MQNIERQVDNTVHLRITDFSFLSIESRHLWTILPCPGRRTRGYRSRAAAS